MSPPASGGDISLVRGPAGAARREPWTHATELQRLLFDQGFTCVSHTGVYDAATVRGVRQLQSGGLFCDPPGVYGICTRAALTA